MAEKKRSEQIAEEIRDVAGVFLARESFGKVLVTVTDVEMSSDLHYANIAVSILPSEQKEVVLEKIEKSLPGLRRDIGKKLKLRRTPELRLDYDNQAEARARVEDILHGKNT